MSTTNVEGRAAGSGSQSTRATRLVSRASIRLPWLLAALSVFLFVWTIREGRIHGQHHMIPHAVERHETCIAAAVSDLKYNLNRGYVCYRKVHQTLENGGMTVNPQLLDMFHYRYPENMLNGFELDNTLNKSLNLSDVESGGVIYTCVFAEDVGYTDFAKIAFRVFGFKISSLYSTYFLIMGVSVATFLAAYRRNVSMLLLLVLVQFGLFLVVRSMPNMNYPSPTMDQYLQLGSVMNGRFLSTLGLIPFLHLGWCLVTWPRPRWVVLVPAVPQAALLGFALHLRGSAVSLFLGLLGIAVIPGLAWLWRRRRDVIRLPVSLSTVGGWAVGHWPLGLVALAFLGHKVYLSTAAHWTYFTDEGLPHHLVWHSAYIGLEYHPKWTQHPMNPGQVGDSMAFLGSESLLMDNGIDKQYLRSFLTNGYKARLHDSLLRQRYLKFVRHNPIYMFELMCWYKPKSIKQYTLVFWNWVRPGLLRTDSLCILSGLGLCLLMAATGGNGRSEWRTGMTVVAACVFGALLPLLWAYPVTHAMTEFVVSLGALAVVGGFVLVRYGCGHVKPLANGLNRILFRKVMAMTSGT